VFFIKVSDIIEFVPVWAGGQLRRKFVCCFHGISVASALLESVHTRRTAKKFFYSALITLAGFKRGVLKMSHGVLRVKNSILTSINPFLNLYPIGARILKLTWHICPTVSADNLFFHRLDALSFMNAGSISLLFSTRS
jgi:hypothetical protein